MDTNLLSKNTIPDLLFDVGPDRYIITGMVFVGISGKGSIGLADSLLTEAKYCLWLPANMTMIYPKNYHRGDAVTAIIPRWLAEKRGLDAKRDL